MTCSLHGQIGFHVFCHLRCSLSPQILNYVSFTSESRMRELMSSFRYKKDYLWFNAVINNLCFLMHCNGQKQRQYFSLFCPQWQQLWQQLSKVSWHCADAYIIAIATEVDTLDSDYTVRTNRSHFSTCKLMMQVL